jgi:hypothetical protein
VIGVSKRNKDDCPTEVRRRRNARFENQGSSRLWAVYASFSPPCWLRAVHRVTSPQHRRRRPPLPSPPRPPPRRRLLPRPPIRPYRSLAFRPSDRGIGGCRVCEEGNVRVWDEATGGAQVIFDGGDVRSGIGDDSRLVAFVRRTFTAGGSTATNSPPVGNGVDGLTPRARLRSSCAGGGAAGATHNFHHDWIAFHCCTATPTRRMLRRGAVRRRNLIDADRNRELAPSDRAFAVLPDGRLVALVIRPASFFDVESGAAVGPGPSWRSGWLPAQVRMRTSAFVVNALVEPATSLPLRALARSR